MTRSKAVKKQKLKLETRVRRPPRVFYDVKKKKFYILHKGKKRYVQVVNDKKRATLQDIQNKITQLLANVTEVKRKKRKSSAKRIRHFVSVPSMEVQRVESVNDVIAYKKDLIDAQEKLLDDIDNEDLSINDLKIAKQELDKIKSANALATAKLRQLPPGSEAQMQRLKIADERIKAKYRDSQGRFIRANKKREEALKEKEQIVDELAKAAAYAEKAAADEQKKPEEKKEPLLKIIEKGQKRRTRSTTKAAEQQQKIEQKPADAAEDERMPSAEDEKQQAEEVELDGGQVQEEPSNEKVQEGLGNCKTKTRALFIKGMGAAIGYKRLKALSNYAIDDIIDELGRSQEGKKLSDAYLGTIARDEIDKLQFTKDNLPVGFIYNTDTADDEGRHWRACYIDNSSVEFYDSLTEPLHNDIVADVLNLVANCKLPHLLKIKLNNYKTQNSDSSSCGYHCIRFLLDRANGKPFKTASGYDVSEKEEEVVANRFMHYC